MQDEVPGPPLDWAEGEEWKQDAAAKAEKSKWPDPASLQGTKDENTLRLLRHSGKIAVCLMDDQLSKIQAVVFSGSLGALVSAFELTR